MRFVLALLVVLCAIFSTIAAPLPLNAVVNIDTGSTSPSSTPGSCDDVNAKIKVLGENIAAVVCLKGDQELPTGMVPNSSTECPDLEARITALGLNIRAIVCLHDGIKIAVNVQ
ncbi:hypothetical protein K7432_012618 [Basidiobolus ranarum]|uniref:Uncharacterized protein n=1 Tax=Basidiobolus ranarum TaxID=34480 RepID=A0ABR2VS04_9FUNG